MTLSLPKALFLGALVFGVIAFDIWFFFGPEGDDNQPVVPTASQAVRKPAPSEPAVNAELDLVHSSEAQSRSSSVAPWLDPIHWRHADRKPLRGNLRSNLMQPVSSDESNDRHQAFATAVPVILWHRERPLAIIGEDIYREGDSFGDYRVRAIEKDRVILVSRRDRDETVLWLAATISARDEQNSRSATSELRANTRPRPRNASLGARSKETP